MANREMEMAFMKRCLTILHKLSQNFLNVMDEVELAISKFIKGITDVESNVFFHEILPRRPTSKFNS